MRVRPSPLPAGKGKMAMTSLMGNVGFGMKHHAVTPAGVEIETERVEAIRRWLESAAETRAAVLRFPNARLKARPHGEQTWEYQMARAEVAEARLEAWSDGAQTRGRHYAVVAPGYDRRYRVVTACFYAAALMCSVLTVGLVFPRPLAGMSWLNGAVWYASIFAVAVLGHVVLARTIHGGLIMVMLKERAKREGKTGGRNVVRFQFEIPPDLWAEMEKFQEKGGLSTKRELVNNALTLFRWAAVHKERGNTIAALTPSGHVHELQMPCLESIEIHSRPSLTRVDAGGGDASVDADAA
jgi:hypothetical protein